VTTKNTTKNVDPIELAEGILAEARSLFAIRKADQEAAAEGVADIKDRLGWGDESVSAEDMVRATFEVDRTAGLVKAAERAIQTAERERAKVLAEHEPLLAQWVADAIKANGWTWGLYGLPVTVGKPGPGAKSPTVWAYQDSPADPVKAQFGLNLTGALSGTVMLVVVTPGAEHIEDASQIMRAAQRLASEVGGEARVSAGRHTQGTVIRMVFKAVRAGMPVLTTKLRQPEAPAVDLIAAVRNAGPLVWARTRSVGPKEQVPAISGQVVSSEEVDLKQDGLMFTRQIESVVRLLDAPRSLVEQTVAAMPGRWSVGAGRIESVEIADYAERAIERTYGADITEATVKLRITLSFRLAR
jgi:hypothetical protein